VRSRRCTSPISIRGRGELAARGDRGMGAGCPGPPVPRSAFSKRDGVRGTPLPERWSAFVRRCLRGCPMIAGLWSQGRRAVHRRGRRERRPVSGGLPRGVGSAAVPTRQKRAQSSCGEDRGGTL
jgi:hypothetical protein